MKNPSTISSGESDERAVSVTEWIRNNYQDHTTVDSLCDALDRTLAALATQPAESKACASVGEPVADPLQGAADWLKSGLVDVTVADIQSRLLIGYNRARRLFDGATPPAAPAATEAPSKPFAYYIHIAAEQRGEFVHNLDEALDDLTNCDCKITELFDHATPAPAVGASVQPAAGALPPVRWWSGVVGSPEKLANLLDGYSEKKESPRRDERVMRAAAKWIREVVASVQPVLASLSDEQITAMAEEIDNDVAFIAGFGRGYGAALAALASSTPTKGGEAS